MTESEIAQAIIEGAKIIAEALNGGYKPPSPTPGPTRFRLVDSSGNKQAPLFPLMVEGDKTKVNWDAKTTIPSGTIVDVILASQISPQFVVSKARLERYLPGYDGPSYVGELPPSVGWILSGTPLYGANKGIELVGLVLNDSDTWLANA